jgi:hypothetical protein
MNSHFMVANFLFYACSLFWIQIDGFFGAYDNEGSAMSSLVGFVCSRCCYISFVELWVARELAGCALDCNNGRRGLFFLFYRFDGSLF